MRSNFDKSLEIILKHEGGYVDHPKDPGGATKYGVTIKTAKKLGLDIDRDGDVDKKDVYLLTPEHVKPVYLNNYWNEVNADKLPSGLDLMAFDWAVNSGWMRAAKKLQHLLGVHEDGLIGPFTLQVLDETINDIGLKTLMKNYHEERQDYYESLKTFKTFGKGWTRRNKETYEFALEMV